MLYITNIELEKKGIVITLSNGSDYFIPKISFDDTLYENVSDWINQIHNKTWMDIDSLYKVGSILSRFSKSIDWIKTFSIYDNSLCNSENSKSSTELKETLFRYKFKL